MDDCDAVLNVYLKECSVGVTVDAINVFGVGVVGKAVVAGEVVVAAVEQK